MSDITRVDRSDRIGLYLSVAFAVVGIAIALSSMVGRLIDVAPGHDIPVRVPLSGETAPLPLGPDGALVTAQVDTVTVVVADPAPATLFALWAQPVVVGLTWSIGLVLAAMFCLQLARADVFTRRSGNLVFIGAGVVTFGWFASSILTNMTTNGAMSAISRYTYETVNFSAGFAPAAAVLLLAAAGTAIRVGERLRRETEGLV